MPQRFKCVAKLQLADPKTPGPGAYDVDKYDAVRHPVRSYSRRLNPHIPEQKFQNPAPSQYRVEEAEKSLASEKTFTFRSRSVNSILAAVRSAPKPGPQSYRTEGIRSEAGTKLYKQINTKGVHHREDEPSSFNYDSETAYNKTQRSEKGGCNYKLSAKRMPWMKAQMGGPGPGSYNIDKRSYSGGLTMHKNTGRKKTVSTTPGPADYNIKREYHEGFSMSGRY